MSIKRLVWMLSLVPCLLLASGVAWGQSMPERFKRKYEAGHPGQSNMSNVWPTEHGYFTLIMKLDSSGPGAYYWGMETVILDSAFEIVSRRSYGDTTREYYRYSTDKFTVPYGMGNFWYWGYSAFPRDSSYAEFYGKFDDKGDTLFEVLIPDSLATKVIWDIVPIPGDRAIIADQQFLGVQGYKTVLHFVDSQGIAYARDTISALWDYYHGADYLTVDTTSGIVLVPTFDQKTTLFDHYDVKPRLFVYDYEGNQIVSRNYADVLHDHYARPFYRTPDGRYFGKLTKIAEDSTGSMFGYQPGVVMLDSNFNFLWKRDLLVPNFDNQATSFHQGLNGEYYMGGKTHLYPSDTALYLNWFIMKFSAKFDSVWTRRYNVDGHDLPYLNQSCKQIVPMDDGRLLCLVTQFSSYSCSYLYMLDECGHLTRECLPVQPPPVDTGYPAPNGGLVAYPNPSDGGFELVWDVNIADRSTLRVYDITGRLLVEQEVVRAETPTALDLGVRPSGVYLLEVTSQLGRRFHTKVRVAR